MERQIRCSHSEIGDHVITVLGANGFIGTHLIHYLKSRNIEHYAPNKGDETLFNKHLGDIIYTIGLTADFRSRPLETVEAHVCILHRLLKKKNFDSLTYLSSTRVYADAEQTNENAVLKVNPIQSGDLYNLSKLMGESLCLHSGYPNTKVIRLSNIIGIRSDNDFFLDQLIAEGYSQGFVEFQTSFDSQKDYLYIDDAIKFIISISQSSENGIFNVASGESISNRQIADFIHDRFRFEIRIRSNAALSNFIPIDTTKTTQIFGFKPRKFADYFPEYLLQIQQSKEL
jgi:nucleoside-diphosphate-sugar epimerase